MREISRNLSYAVDFTHSYSTHSLWNTGIDVGTPDALRVADRFPEPLLAG
jgi:hypothetical protein